MFDFTLKKTRIRNSKYKAKKIDFNVVKSIVIAIIFSLISLYFVYFLVQFSLSGLYSSMGGYGIALIVCVFILTIIFWIIVVETFNDTKCYNFLTKIGQVNVEYIDFYNEYLVVCENSHEFKIEYSDIKSMEFFINAGVTSGKYYLKDLDLNVSYSIGEDLKDISIKQEPSLMVVDQIFEILYFAQRCPNFSLKFSNENEILQTTLGKAISSYFNNNCHHTFRSFAQTTKGVFLLLVIILLPLLVLFWFNFSSLFN